MPKVDLHGNTINSPMFLVRKNTGSRDLLSTFGKCPENRPTSKIRISVIFRDMACRVRVSCRGVQSASQENTSVVITCSQRTPHVRVRGYRRAKSRNFPILLHGKFCKNRPTSKVHMSVVFEPIRVQARVQGSPVQAASSKNKNDVMTSLGRKPRPRVRGYPKMVDRL
jgi:hypothetical protein